MISSKKRSFEEYKVITEKRDLLKDKSASNLAAKHINDKVIPNSIFILNYTRFDDHSFIERIGRELTDFTVYSSYVNRKNFSDCSHVKFVKKNTDEFFAALYSSQYIIADTELSVYYRKREEQTVISVIDAMDDKSLESVCEWNKCVLRSSAVTCANGKIDERFSYLFPNLSSFSGAKLEGKDVIDFIRSKQSKSTVPSDSTKKKILIATLFDKYEKWLPMLCNYLESVDYDSYEITMILEKKHISVLSGFLNRFIKKVNMVSRTGWFLIDEKDRRMYDYFNTDLPYFENPDEIYEYIDKDIYERELQRTAGNVKYDALLLYGDRLSNKNYWLNIGRAANIEEKHIVFSEDLYASLIDNPEADVVVNKSATKLYLSFDNIWFWSGKQIEDFKEKVQKNEFDLANIKLSLVSLLPSKMLDYDTEIIEFNYEKYIMYNYYNADGNKINVTKLPKDTDSAVAIVLSEEKNFMGEQTECIKEYIHNNEEKEIFIFDINEISATILKSVIEEEKNAKLCQGAMYYYIYLNYINNYVIFPGSEARVQELKSLNKNIINGLE